MLKKTVFAMAMITFFVATASAQSYTLTDADSNLTDTQLTADFSGLPADTQLTLESLGDDTTEQATFTSTSGGTATVSWRHNPFEDGTALISDGWTYRIRDSSGDFNYEFEVAHGNMILGLDTFFDNSINSNFWTVETTEEGVCGFSRVRENSGQFKLENEVGFQDSVESNECNSIAESKNSTTKLVHKFNVETVDTPFDGKAKIRIVSDSGNIITSTSASVGSYTLLIEDSEAIIKQDGSVVSSSTTTENSFKTQFYSSADAFDAESTEVTRLYISDYSQVPKISRNAWLEPNRFNPERSSILFGSFLINQNGDSGIEFSKDGSSWSSTPPSSGNELYYRNIGAGTLGSVAVDSSPLFEELTFNPIRPDNNTAFVVEENASLNRDFLYEILYERTDCSEFAGLFSAFSLYNQSSGNTITDTVYPSLEMTENQCVFYKEFTEEENLPAGDYRWRVEFQDSNLGISEVWNQYFSIEEAQDVPVSFELRDPAEGETVYLDNGSTEFSYSVDADTQGTLELVIPQYEDSVRYSKSIGSGNRTGSVVLNLDYGVNYDWYLTWTNSTTYQSETNSFNTASKGESPDDGTNGDTGTTDEPFIDIGGLYYSLTGVFGLGESASNILGSVLMGFLFSAVATFIGSYGGMTGTVFPTVGFITGLAISSLIGLIGGWFVFILAVLTALVMAKTGGSAFGE